MNNIQFSPTSFQNQLSGPNAFYNNQDYIKNTQEDFAKTQPLPKVYTINFETRLVRIIKLIVSIILFPLYYFHVLAAKILLPASNSDSLMYRPPNYLVSIREAVNLTGPWLYKRINVEVDGYSIDATIMGTADTLNNGRWVLSSGGNGEFYENKLESNEFKQILSTLNGNALVFNYPGVGSSSGMPNKNAMVKAYRAMLHFLEDKEGIGAKQIIGYGHSIGGGVQSEALKSHVLKTEENIHYVFVKSRTFSDLTAAAKSITNRVIGSLVTILGWNFASVESSKKLQVHEIILQTARVSNCYKILFDSSKIIDDGIISAEASLAKNLLDDPTCPRDNKTFIGIPETHNMELLGPTLIADMINLKLPKLEAQTASV